MSDRTYVRTYNKVCQAPGCDVRLHKATYCTEHRQRLNRTGQLERKMVSVTGKIVGDDRRRFFSKVNVNGLDCWAWTARTDVDGYGVFRLRTAWVRAHRWSYENLTGQTIPEGMVIDHLCRNRGCVNPMHLEVVTPAENTKRGVRPAPPIACPHGHAYDEVNTMWKDGRRQCRECNRIRNRRWNALYGAEYQRRRAAERRSA